MQSSTYKQIILMLCQQEHDGSQVTVPLYSIRMPFLVTALYAVMSPHSATHFSEHILAIKTHVAIIELLRDGQWTKSAFLFYFSHLPSREDTRSNVCQVDCIFCVILPGLSS